MGWWNNNPYDANGYGAHFAGGGWLMMFVMAAFWLFVIGLVVLAATGWRRRGMMSPGHHAMHGTGQDPVPGSARDLLDRRFATGEITSEQYAEMRRVLESGRHGG